MNTTRRNFIKASAVAAIFAGTDLFASLASAAEFSGGMPNGTSADRLLYLTSEDFKKHIGAQFSLIGEKEVIAARLLDVTHTVKPIKVAQYLTGRSRQKLLKETFTLSFQVSTDDFSQETFQVWHPNLGQFDLFLVPGAKEREQVLIHAVINRI